MNQVVFGEAFAARQPVTNQAESSASTASSFNSRCAQLTAVRAALKARRARARFFAAGLFADPAWDMLLELYAGSLTERRLTVSRLADRSGVPMTTALRWMATLETEGLIRRVIDPLDRRRNFLLLTDEGTAAMNAFCDDFLPGTPLL